MIRKIFFLIILAFIVICSKAYSEEQEKVIGIVNFQHLKAGMSQDDVIKISGFPTLISKDSSGKPIYVYLRENLRATLTRTMKHNKDGSIVHENYLLMDTGTPSGFSIQIMKFDKNNMVESFKSYSDAEIPKIEAERGAIKIAEINLVDKDGKPLKEELKIGMTQAKVTEISGLPKLISKGNEGKDIWIYLAKVSGGELKHESGKYIVQTTELGVGIEIVKFDKNSLIESLEDYSLEF